MTLAELITAARAAVEAGNLDEAERLTNQARAIKALDVLETPAPAPEPVAVKSTPIRPPFAVVEPVKDETQDDEGAIKSWAAKRVYVKKYGEPEAAFDQIANELYPRYVVNGGSDYYGFMALKHADFNQYLK